MPSAILLVSIFRLPSRIAALIDSTFAVSMSELFDARRSVDSDDKLTVEFFAGLAPDCCAVLAAPFASFCDARCRLS